jgi:UDP-N-acetylmuramyl tripeptide synthase
VASPAYALARAAGGLSRRLGRGGGTSLPGKVLLRLRPDAIREMARRIPEGAVVLSATNGKTTTSRLLAGCIRASGRGLVTNPGGANLQSGVASALLAHDGRPADIALFEVDEAALPAVSDQLRPRVVLLMNLFRDQLDRYGELEELATRWQAMVGGLPAGTVVILNADDPLVAALGEGRDGVVYFGIDDPDVALATLPHAADSTRCRACGAALVYDAVRLGHMGSWRCAGCGRRRPTPQVRVTHATVDGLDGVDLDVTTPAGEVRCRLGLPGIHNAYNAAAAVAAAWALGIPGATVATALEQSQAAFGRAERLTIGDREAMLLLAKNPAGANETVRTLLLSGEPLDLLIALNDRTADGRDVSWIWDVDYEPLLPRVRHLTLTGDRAWDLALRFRYGGLAPARMRVVPDLAAAVDHAVAATPAGGRLAMLPTYTAMLELRRLLVSRGLAQDHFRDR